jgi:ribosomal protein S18 acetylase RimI-like enzyme
MSRSTPIIRQLAAHEFDEAYHIVVDAAAWLEEQHLPCWLIPVELYQQHQIAGKNYGLFDAGKLCGVVTISTEIPVHWGPSITHLSCVWVSTVARIRTVPKSYGQQLMAFVELYAQQIQRVALYLDCYYGNGKLPQYYRQLGYEWVERKSFIFDDGSVHDSVLFRKLLRIGVLEDSQVTGN